MVHLSKNHSLTCFNLSIQLLNCQAAILQVSAVLNQEDFFRACHYLSLYLRSDHMEKVTIECAVKKMRDSAGI